MGNSMCPISCDTFHFRYDKNSNQIILTKENYSYHSLYWWCLKGKIFFIAKLNMQLITWIYHAFFIYISYKMVFSFHNLLLTCISDTFFETLKIISVKQYIVILSSQSSSSPLLFTKNERIGWWTGIFLIFRND